MALSFLFCHKGDDQHVFFCRPSFFHDVNPILFSHPKYCFHVSFPNLPPGIQFCRHESVLLSRDPLVYKFVSQEVLPWSPSNLFSCQNCLCFLVSLDGYPTRLGPIGRLIRGKPHSIEVKVGRNLARPNLRDSIDVEALDRLASAQGDIGVSLGKQTIAIHIDLS